MSKNNPKNDRTTIWVKKSLHKDIKQLALDKNQSIEVFVMELLTPIVAKLMLIRSKLK